MTPACPEEIVGDIALGTEAAGQNWSTRALERQSEQLFASKYRLILPSEEELRREIESERVAIQGA